MSKVTLRDIVDHQCNAGITTWQIDGAMIPKLWAVGTRGIIAAQPTEYANDLTPAQRIEMLWLMSLVCDGRYLGRVDEAWIREQHPSEPLPTATLDESADSDPRVKTAITVHGADIVTGKLRVVLAILDLDRYGDPVWRKAHASTSIWPEQHTVLDAAALAGMSGKANRDDALRRFTDYSERHEWASIYIDDEDD